MREVVGLRMYFFVPYNIMPIQHGIQAGHAALRMALKYGRNNPDAQIWDFIEDHETFIILNGGPTNLKYDHTDPGHLGNIQYELERIGVAHDKFFEPDLNDALSAVCFIAPEQVWDYEMYPDLDKFAKPRMKDLGSKWAEVFRNGPLNYNDASMLVPEIYTEWRDSMGGDQNVEMRQLLKGKRLA